MEDKQEAILAVENPFFMDAKIIETIDKLNIVFYESLWVNPERFLCITSDGILFHCLKNKKGISEKYNTNIKITKGIVDVLKFLHDNSSLIKKNGDHSTDLLSTCNFVLKLIQKLDYSHNVASMKKESKKRKKYKRRKKSKRR
tara:strand:+ start:82 stop:510 length:429 start_codon:yes stop_codon:yes gene_type:complete